MAIENLVFSDDCAACAAAAPLFAAPVRWWRWPSDVAAARPFRMT